MLGYEDPPAWQFCDVALTLAMLCYKWRIRRRLVGNSDEGVWFARSSTGRVENRGGMTGLCSPGHGVAARWENSKESDDRSQFSSERKVISRNKIERELGLTEATNEATEANPLSRANPGLGRT